MDVSIKSFEVEMDVKNKGIALGVSEPNGGKALGVLVITKTGLIWCDGKTRQENGKKIKWAELVAMVNSTPEASPKAAAKKPLAKKRGRKAAVKAARPVVAPETK